MIKTKKSQPNLPGIVKETELSRAADLFAEGMEQIAKLKAGKKLAEEMILIAMKKSGQLDMSVTANGVAYKFSIDRKEKLVVRKIKEKKRGGLI